MNVQMMRLSTSFMVPLQTMKRIMKVTLKAGSSPLDERVLFKFPEKLDSRIPATDTQVSKSQVQQALITTTICPTAGTV